MTKKKNLSEEAYLFLANCAAGNMQEDPQELRKQLMKHMGEDFGKSWTARKRRFRFGRLLALPFQVVSTPLRAIGAISEGFANFVTDNNERMFKNGFFHREDGTSIFSVMEPEDVKCHRPVSEMSDDELSKFFNAGEATQLFRGEMYRLLHDAVYDMRDIKGVNWNDAVELLDDPLLQPGKRDHYGNSVIDNHIAEKLGHITDRTYDPETEDIKILQRHEREGILTLMDIQRKFKDYPIALETLRNFVEDGLKRQDMPGQNMKELFVTKLFEAYSNEAKKREAEDTYGKTSMKLYLKSNNDENATHPMKMYIMKNADSKETEPEQNKVGLVKTPQKASKTGGITTRARRGSAHES